MTQYLSSDIDQADDPLSVSKPHHHSASVRFSFLPKRRYTPTGQKSTMAPTDIRLVHLRCYFDIYRTIFLKKTTVKRESRLQTKTTDLGD